MEEFVSTTEIGKILLEYIGSEEYLKAVESIQDSGKAAFMSGIGMAGCLIMSRCQKYYAETDKENKE